MSQASAPAAYRAPREVQRARGGRAAGDAEMPPALQVSQRYADLDPFLTTEEAANLPGILQELSALELDLLRTMPLEIFAQSRRALTRDPADMRKFLSALRLGQRWAEATGGQPFPSGWVPQAQEVAFLLRIAPDQFARIATSDHARFLTGVGVIADSVPPGTPVPSQLTEADVTRLLAMTPEERPAALRAMVEAQQAPPPSSEAPPSTTPPAVQGADTSAPPTEEFAARDQGAAEEQLPAQGNGLATSTDKGVQVQPPQGLGARWQALNTAGKVAVVVAGLSVGYLLYTALVPKKEPERPAGARPGEEPARNPVEPPAPPVSSYARQRAAYARAGQQAGGYGRLSSEDVEAIRENTRRTSQKAAGPRKGR
jgi:hypothetical protein